MSAMEKQGEVRDVQPAGGFRFTLRGLLIAVAVFGIFIGVTYPAVNAARTAAHRMQEGANLKQLAFALHNYHETHGTFPQAIICDPNGKPFRSWRVEVLPFVESQQISNNYRHNEPWNSPANMTTCDLHYPVFKSPSQSRSSRYTNVVMPTGPGTVGERAIGLSDIKDEPFETVLLLALMPSDVLWHEPRDLHINDITRDPDNPTLIMIKGRPFRGAHCAFADASVAWLPADLNYDTFRAMLTIDGGEKVNMSWRGR